MAEVGTIVATVATHFHTSLTTMATPPGTLKEVIEKHSGGQGKEQGKNQKVAVAATDEEVELTYGELGGEIQHILLPLSFHSPHFLLPSPSLISSHFSFSSLSSLAHTPHHHSFTSSQIFFSTPCSFFPLNPLLLPSLI